MFPTPGDGRVVVVGAGTAGCVVAGRLAEAGYGVDLLDAGPAASSSSDERLASTDHLRAHQAPDRWWPSLTVFRGDGGPSDRRVPYTAGRGLGGSSAVNGLLADVDPDDPVLGPSDEVAAALARCRLAIERPDVEELGDLDRAVLGLSGARRLDLHRSNGLRADIAAAYLADDHDINVVGGALVDRVAERRSTSGRVMAAVITEAGDEYEAAAVILCAGSIHTPAILQRSRMGEHVGVGLQGHPAVSIPLVRRPPARYSAIVTGVVVDRGPVQLLPLDHTSASPKPSTVPDRSAPGTSDAALLVALMQPSGAAGSVEIVSDDPADEPLVTLRSFDDPNDLAALVAGVREAFDVLASPPIEELIESIAAEHGGRPLSDLDDRELAAWIEADPGAHSHLVGGCAIGRTLDDDGRVVGTTPVYVADASAFPRVPRTGPHLPTIVQAERLSARWRRAKMNR